MQLGKVWHGLILQQVNKRKGRTEDFVLIRKEDFEVVGRTATSWGAVAQR
jgi:hypothetical protein